MFGQHQAMWHRMYSRNICQFLPSSLLSKAEADAVLWIVAVSCTASRSGGYLCLATLRPCKNLPAISNCLKLQTCCGGNQFCGGGMRCAGNGRCEGNCIGILCPSPRGRNCRSTLIDPDSCGACGKACLPVANGRPNCMGGTCYNLCLPGYVNDPVTANCVPGCKYRTSHPSFPHIHNAD
jgi:hypothetical protein